MYDKHSFRPYTMLTIKEIQFAFELAVVAYVFVCILQKDDNIFEKYGDFLTWVHGFKYGYYIANPLGYCENCFAGQLAFWLYIKLNYHYYLHDLFNNVVQHIIFVSLTIFITSLIKIIIKKWN